MAPKAVSPRSPSGLVALLLLQVFLLAGLTIAWGRPTWSASARAVEGSPGPGAVGIGAGVFHPYREVSEARPRLVGPKDKTMSLGIHVENAYELSLKDRSFRVEGWYWLRWPERINEILKEREIPPTGIVEFTNIIQASELAMEAYEPVAQRLPGGDYLQEFRFSGKLYISDLDLRSFPFVSLRLPILVETAPDALSCSEGGGYGCVSLVFDQGSHEAALGQFVSINGYETEGVWSSEFMHQYPTSFGHSVPSAFASVRLDILYKTSFLPAFGSYVFPLLVLVGVALVSPSLPGSMGDVRLAIPTTILLTLIFLQQAYKAELPSLAYITYLDWFYIFAYAISAALFCLFCWGTNLYAKADADGHEQVALRRINRVDLLFQALAAIGLIGFLLLMLRF